MNIPKILNKTYFLFPLKYWLVFAPVLTCQGYQDYKMNEQAKTEIEIKDPERYKMLSERSDESLFKSVNWCYERSKMNDSLRVDSLVKKAYFEGAQMVRDSLSNIQNCN